MTQQTLETMQATPKPSAAFKEHDVDPADEVPKKSPVKTFEKLHRLRLVRMTVEGDVEKRNERTVYWPCLVFDSLEEYEDFDEAGISPMVRCRLDQAYGRTDNAEKQQIAQILGREGRYFVPVSEGEFSPLHMVLRRGHLQFTCNPKMFGSEPAQRKLFLEFHRAWDQLLDIIQGEDSSKGAKDAPLRSWHYIAQGLLKDITMSDIPETHHKKFTKPKAKRKLTPAEMLKSRKSSSAIKSSSLISSRKHSLKKRV